MCDDGRIRTREPCLFWSLLASQGHIEGSDWNETKNTTLLHVTHQAHDVDPQPEPPDCFRDANHVAQMAQCGALEPENPESEGPVPEEPAGEETPFDHRPKRLVRMVVSRLATS